MKESKDDICRAMCAALKLTRKYEDLIALTYCIDEHDHEWVVPRYWDGEKEFQGTWIDVTADSGWAIIQDIVKKI